jgi:hypothetical protein
VAANEGGLSALGYRLTFTVTTLDGSLVHDFHQHFDATVTGTDAIAQVNGQAFTNDASGSFLAGIGIGIHEGDPPTSDVEEILQQDVSSLLFQHFLLVQTSGGGFLPIPEGRAAIPFTDLTFSQIPPSPVPEPNTFILFGLGIFAAGRHFWRRPAY